MSPGRGIAAIVVNYNAASCLERCLRSIRANGIPAAIVVDNGSTDGSRLAVEQAGAHWLPAGANLGYGRAANLGAASLPARSAAHLLICNPDVELEPGAVERLVETMEGDPSLGLVGPALLNPDGSVYPSARSFPGLLEAMGHGFLGFVAPRNRYTRSYRMLDWDHSELGRVDWVSGACFLARRVAWDALGGFDPSYFMYLEDVDLCWRAARSGWAVAYQPAARVLHVQGVSAGQHPYRMLAAHHRSMWRFARKSASGAGRAALPLVGVGLLVRLAAAVALHCLGLEPGAGVGAAGVGAASGGSGDAREGSRADRVPAPPRGGPAPPTGGAAPGQLP